MADKKQSLLTNASFALLAGIQLQIPFLLLLFGICASLGKNLSRKIWTGIGPIVKPEVWTAILYTSLWMGMFEVEVCMMWCGGK